MEETQLVVFERRTLNFCEKISKNFALCGFFNPTKFQCWTFFKTIVFEQLVAAGEVSIETFREKFQLVVSEKLSLEIKEILKLIRFKANSVYQISVAMN